MKKLFLSILVLMLFADVMAQRVLIYCGTLIDVVEGRQIKEVTVVVEGEKISAVENGYMKPGRKDEVIDLKGYTVMPGLIDLHVHLEGETSKDRYIKRFTQNPADVAFEAAVFARKTLHSGFTTVRDLGGSGVNTSLRNAVNSGLVEGPRIFSCGKSIATTGGHADPTNSYRDDLMGNPNPRDGVVNGPYEARQAVRQRYKDGSDNIKITVTGGVLSVAKDGQGPQFFQDEVDAIVQTANDYGLITAAHAHGAEGMKRAVLAGITTIEHGTKMTDEVMDLMIENGTWYVPTITAGRSVAEYAKIAGYYPKLVVPKALEIGPMIQETFGKAYRKGVKIAFGTDAGVFPHGENWREFVYMVEAGMPPMEAIQSATIKAAEVLRIQDEAGAIEKGKYADIVAVKNNPIADIKNMEHVEFVMRWGKIYKSPQGK